MTERDPYLFLWRSRARASYAGNEQHTPALTHPMSAKLGAEAIVALAHGRSPDLRKRYLREFAH